MPAAEPATRVKGFSEIEPGYSREQAAKEASRCLQCDLRLQILQQILPPEDLMAFTQENIEGAPSAEGVLLLLGADKELLYVSGVQDIKQALREQMGKDGVKYFKFEKDPFYTKRESELLQQHLQKKGKMPKYNDELGDLF